MKTINTHLSILLVEDTNYKIEKVRTFIQQIVLKSEIIIAKDQIQAQKKLEQQKFDLMILDMQLPHRIGESEPDKKGGENLLEELYFNELLIPPTKIITLTEYVESQMSVRDNFPELGAIKFDAISDDWQKNLHRTLSSLAKAKKIHKKIVYCEEQNDELYNLIGFLNLEFRGLKGGSRKVYEEAKFNKSSIALRDKDYLAKNEIIKLKNKYPNYFILDYYCFENYLFHPDNIEEYAISIKLDFDKEEYIKEIVKQKEEKLIQIAQDYKAARNCIDIKENNTNKEIRENHKEVFKALRSDNFETFYQYFDMKGTKKNKGFDKTCLEHYSLDKKELVKTNWFKNKIGKVLGEIV